MLKINEHKFEKPAMSTKQLISDSLAMPCYTHVSLKQSIR